MAYPTPEQMAEASAQAHQAVLGFENRWQVYGACNCGLIDMAGKLLCEDIDRCKTSGQRVAVIQQTVNKLRQQARVYCPVCTPGANPDNHPIY